MNEQTEQALDAVFSIVSTETDIAPIEITTGELVASTPTEAPTQAEMDAQEDYEFSRGALKSVATEAQNTLHRAVEVAEQTDTPRAFEAVADMVRATLEAHRELHGLHKTAAEVRLAAKAVLAPAPGTVNIQQGVVFSGTSEELLRLISKDRQ